MKLTVRQQNIIDIVKLNQPITGNDIANALKVSKSTLRSDLSILTLTGYLMAKPKVGYYINIQDKSQLNTIKSDINQLKVSDVKSTAVCVEENISLHNTIIEIFAKDAGTVFITDENNYLKGIVSRKDFLKSILGSIDIHSVPINVIMTRMPNIIVTEDDEDIITAAKKIIEHKIDAIPVVKKISENQYKVTGRFSKTTIAHLFAKYVK